MKKITVVLIFILLTTSKFTAQVKDISFTLSPAAEYTWWDNQSGLKNGTLIGGKLGFGFGEYIELRGVYLQSLDLQTDFSNYGISNFDKALFNSQNVTLTRWGGEFKANIGTKKFKPYFTVGTGVQNIEVDSKDFEQIYASLGLGFKVNLAKRAILSIEAKNTAYNFNTTSNLLTATDKTLFNIDDATTKTDRLSNWGLMGSLQFYLGGRKPGTLTDLDEAYLNKIKGGFKGMQLIFEPSIAHISFDDKSLFKDTYMLGGYAGFDFNEYIGLRGFYFNATNNDEISLDFDKLSMYGLEFRARLNDGNGVTPYLILGGGYLNADNAYIGKNTLEVPSGEFATGGLGLNIPLGKRILISGGLRALFTTGEDIANISMPNEIQTHLMYNAGIKFTIGRNAKDPLTPLNSKKDDVINTPVDTRNIEKINALKKEYQSTLTALDNKLEKAYEAKDVNTAILLLEEKKEVLQALNEIEKFSAIESQKNTTAPNNTIIQMKPAEFESLIDRILNGLSKETTPQNAVLNVSDSINNNQLDLLNARIKRLETLLLESKDAKSAPLNVENKNESKVIDSEIKAKKEVEIEDSKTLETTIPLKKEVNSKEAKKAEKAKTKEAKDAKKAADKVEQRLDELNKKVEENSANISKKDIETKETASSTKDVKDMVVIDDSKNTKASNDFEFDLSEKKKSYLTYNNSSIQAGYQFSNSGNAVIAARTYFSMGNSVFELMPEVLVGFADKTTAAVSVNIIYPFLKENKNIQPYLGAGLGSLYNGTKVKGLYSIIMGSYLPFVSKNVYVDYTMNNSFDLNQISVGYKLPF
jgi:hypothetical protein